MSEPRVTRRLAARTAAGALDARAVVDAAEWLAQGGLVAFPTETVYGLGADAGDGVAVAALYAAKGRPSFNPLIAHVPDLASAEREGVFTPAARQLAQAFWPGPLTLVVPVQKDSRVCALARAGLDSVALRVPAHPVAHALLRAASRPIVAPSANRSGHVSPTRADHVAADLDGRIDIILDDGPTPHGLESTIVSLLDGEIRLLRPGPVTRDALTAILGPTVSLDDGPAGADLHHAQPRAPGLLASHYAPRASVHLRATGLGVQRGDAILDFARQLLGRQGDVSAYIDLSPHGVDREAAARLFDAMRSLDSAGVGAIHVAPIPDHGLGVAINDRLARAAAPKSAEQPSTALPVPGTVPG
jgi:L-threonylcarbamoyladenylate synthase